MITVLLADDSVLVRKSTLRLLEDHTDIDVMAEAAGFVKSIELILKLRRRLS
jgi:DNA-binding NarL/FixJ family response regulator